MKKFILRCLFVLLLMFVIASMAVAESTAVGIPVADVGEPFSWVYLATIAGAAAFTLLVVQFLKVPLDKVWRIPTRVFAYIIALGTMLIATQFTVGLTIDTALLAAVNAVIAALTAYGSYELTFAKLSKPPGD